MNTFLALSNLNMAPERGDKFGMEFRICPDD